MSALGRRAAGAAVQSHLRMCAPARIRCGLPRQSHLRPHNAPSLQAPARHYSANSTEDLATTGSPSPPLPRSLILKSLAKILGWFAVGLFVGSLELYYLAYVVKNMPTNEQTLSLVTPNSDEERRVNDYITSHPLAVEMRSKPGFVESRPHMKVPPQWRAGNLTAGTLMGPGKMVVPPLAFAEEGGKSLVSLAYLGKELCGHPGIVHGGLLATLLDEGLARCCFAALPHKAGVTATLNINYRAPAPTDSYIVLRAVTTKVEGRKAWVEGRIETLAGPGETPTVLADATALFISPKQAALMSNIYSPD